MPIAGTEETMSYRRFLASAVTGVLLLAGCSEPTGPPLAPRDSPSYFSTATGQSLTPLRHGAGLQAYQVSFWAVRGQARSAIVHYREYQTTPSRGDEDDADRRSRAARFLRVFVPADGLSKLPNGTAIATGDSVLITVSIDNTHVVARFAPTGLVFNPSSPVTLEVWYSGAILDLDGDGDVDAADNLIGATKLALWHQSQPGTAWDRQPALHSWENRYFLASLTSFSGYAVSW